MSPPKLQPYWIFVSSAKKQAEREGTVFSEEECGRLWKDMSPEHRAPYIEIAKQKNGLRSCTPSTSCPSDTSIMATGQKSSVPCEPDTRIIQATMRAYFTETLSQSLGKSVLIAASNTLVPYDGDDDRCVPLEIAFVTYSVSGGIESMFQKFSDPGTIPAGCVYESRKHSQETHGIPAVDFSLAIGKDGLHQLLAAVTTLMRKCYNSTLPILLFTRADMVGQVRASLGWYAKVANYRRLEKLLDQNQLLVIDLAYLVAHMSMMAGQGVTLAECHCIMNSVMFDYKNRCTFHHTIDNNYCALSLCCRWSYLMSDYLLSLPSINITAIPGRHLPVADTSAIHHGDNQGLRFWGDERSESAEEATPDASPEPAAQPSARSRVSSSGAADFSLTSDGRRRRPTKQTVTFDLQPKIH